MNFRIAFISDLLLDGCDFVPLNDDFNEQLQHKRKQTFSNIIDFVSEYQPDVFIIGGNLFNFSKVSYNTIKFLKQELARISKTPVLISPGDLDPYTIGSYYASFNWGDHVFIFKDETLTPFEFSREKIVIWGVACKNLLVHPPHLKPPKNTEFDQHTHIIAFHGTPNLANMEGSPSNSFPFSMNQFVDANYSNLIVGNKYPIDSHFPDDIITFSGAAFPFIDCKSINEAGHLLTYEIDTISGNKKIDRVPISATKVHKFEINISDFETELELYQTINQKIMPQYAKDDMFFLKLTGRPQLGCNFAVNQIEKQLKAYFYVELEDQTSPFINWEKYKDEISLKNTFIDTLDSYLKTHQPHIDEELKDRSIYFGLTALMKNKDFRLL